MGGIKGVDAEGAEEMQERAQRKTKGTYLRDGSRVNDWNRYGL